MNAVLRLVILSIAAIALGCSDGDTDESTGTPEYYSQFGQDRWVIEEVFPGVTDGYFVDIGSANGVLDSNSKALEDLGWTGICIDPFPTNMDGRSAQVFREVVYSTEGEIVEFRVAGGLGGIDKHIDRWKQFVEGSPTVQLRTTTIGRILTKAAAPPFIHYISLDTEGSEYEILSVFPFDEYKVGAFSIEHNLMAEKRQRIRTLLEDQGYRFVKNVQVDDLFISATPP